MSADPANAEPAEWERKRKKRKKRKRRPPAALPPGLTPFAVEVEHARALLGNMARSRVYDEIGAGRLDAVKDGDKTLITYASILRRQRGLPRADIKQTVKG